MPDYALIPRFPTPAHLAWFFRERPTLTTKEAGDVLGWLDAQVHFRALDEGGLLPGDRVAWEDVAFWLLSVWPRAWLMETLGPAARLLPDGLHLTHIPWELPRYIVRAMERQAALRCTPDDVQHQITVQDYVARVLHLAIEPDTAEALAGDPVFADAYDYPHARNG